MVELRKIVFIALATIIVLATAPSKVYAGVEQIIFDIGGALVAKMIESNNNSSASEQPASTLWRKKEQLTVGKYNINIVEGLSEQVPDIYFIALYNGRVAKSLTFYRKNPDDMKMINGFNNLSEPEKKKQIVTWFKYVNFDLDLIESEQAQISKENTATKP